MCVSLRRRSRRRSPPLRRITAGRRPEIAICIRQSQDLAANGGTWPPHAHLPSDLITSAELAVINTPTTSGAGWKWWTSPILVMDLLRSRDDLMIRFGTAG